MYFCISLFYLSASLSSSAFCFPFRSNTHSAAWPGPKIQNQHQGPFPRIWQVPSRSSNGHHQRDAASVQVNTTRQNHQLHSYPFSRKVKPDFDIFEWQLTQRQSTASSWLVKGLHTHKDLRLFHLRVLPFKCLNEYKSKFWPFVSHLIFCIWVY